MRRRTQAKQQAGESFRRNSWIVVGVALLWAMPSFSESLTLDQAIAQAMNHNPDLLQTESVVEESRAAIPEVTARVLPVFSFFGQYSASDDIRTQLPDSNAALIKVDENLFDGGRFFSELRRVKALEGSARASRDQKRLEIALMVKEAFFRGLLAQEQARLWERAQDEFLRLLKLIEPQFTVGSVPEYDYAKVQLSLVQYRTELRRVRSDFQHQLVALGALLGGPTLSQLEPLPGAVPAPPALSLEKLIESVHATYPEFRSARSQLEADDAAAITAARERWPNLKLTADYGYSGFTARDASLGWGVTATLTVPFFEFGGIRARISQARARRAAQEAKIEALRLRLRTDVNDLMEGLKVTWENYQAARANLPRAERAWRSSLRRYRTHIATMTELSDAHGLWIQTQIASTQALTEYRTNLARLEALHP